MRTCGARSLSLQSPSTYRGSNSERSILACGSGTMGWVIGPRRRKRERDGNRTGCSPDYTRSTTSHIGSRRSPTSRHFSQTSSRAVVSGWLARRASDVGRRRIDPYVEDPRATHNAASQALTIAQQAGWEKCRLVFGPTSIAATSSSRGSNWPRDYQVLLGRHHLADVLVDPGHLVRSRREHFDSSPANSWRT